MNEEQKMVLEFHEQFELLINTTPKIVGKDLHDLRVALIDEEFKELKEAMQNKNMIKIADGIADLLYVIYGTAITYGLDIEPIFREVHRSNMSKGNPEVVRAPNGKILKGKNWSPPDFSSLLEVSPRENSVTS